MQKSHHVILVLLCATFWISGCDGVSESQLAEVRAVAEEAKNTALEARTMAAEARDIALRAEQKADQALATANDAKSTAEQALAEARDCCARIRTRK